MCQHQKSAVSVTSARFMWLAPRFTSEPEVTKEPQYVGDTFARAGIHPKTVVVAIEPTPDQIAHAADRAAAADATVLFLYDAHLYASNRALLDAVRARARALAVVLLRDPYDAALLSPQTLGITAYGWRRCQLDAVIARLCH